MNSLSKKLSFGGSNTTGHVKPDPIRVLLNGGDNMLGRAVQLTFPHQAKGDHSITDSCPAWHYLDLSMHPMQKGGSPPLTIEEIKNLNSQGSYLWGDYRHLVISDPQPQVRILNLETAVTTSIDASDIPTWKLRYHFHELNMEPALFGYQHVSHHREAADGTKNVSNSKTHGSPVVVTFANNHALDCGMESFVAETLPRFKSITDKSKNSIKFAGAGIDLDQATKPCTIPLSSGEILKVFAVGSSSSGIVSTWAAKRSRPGVFWVNDLDSEQSVEKAFEVINKAIKSYSENPKKDKIVLSIHWGGNWAYKYRSDIDAQKYRRLLAHRLIDESGVDLIYGHSSHHLRGMEIWNGKLILYGTGDLINDYEGFSNPGEETYNQCGGIFIVDLAPSTGQLMDLHIVPTYMDRLSLRRWIPGAEVWNPISKQMESNPNGIEDFCAFVNQMTYRDASNKDTAVKLAVSRENKIVPGGPVLRWDIGGEDSGLV